MVFFVSVLAICVILMFYFLFIFVCFFSETSQGKYISPFHDISLIAETEQVILKIKQKVHDSKHNIKRLEDRFFFRQQDNDVPAKKAKKTDSEVPSNSNISYQLYHLKTPSFMHTAFFCTFRCSITWSWRYLDGQMPKWR